MELPLLPPFLGDYSASLAEGGTIFQKLFGKEMRATDAAGNTDGSAAVHSWTIDLAPDTTVDSGPDTPTASTSATFTFSSNEPGASFECALDEATFSSCSSPAEYTSLDAGAHEFRVRAKDGAATSTTRPPAYTWTITEPPNTTIDSVTPDDERRLADRGDARDASRSAATRPARRSCARWTRPSPQSAARPPSTPACAPGAHDFEVEAIGAAGNVDPTPATFSWEIGDLTPPVVEILEGPATDDRGHDADLHLRGRTTDAAVLECSLDGATPTLCGSSPKTYTEAELRAATGSAAGTHTFEITVVKEHLLVDAEPALWEWTVEDHTAPETTIESGPVDELLEGTLATFEFSSSEPDAEFECAFEPAEPNAPLEWSTCASPPENTAEFNQPAGEHTLLVRAVDPSLNADSSPAEYSWTVVGAPVTTIQSGPPASPDTTSDRTATFTFAADQAERHLPVLARRRSLHEL